VDSRTSLSLADYEAADWLRRRIKSPRATGERADQDRSLPAPTVTVIANKCDNFGDSALVATALEAVSLGLGNPVPYSAETQAGTADLYGALRETVDALSRGGSVQRAHPSSCLHQCIIPPAHNGPNDLQGFADDKGSMSSCFPLSQHTLPAPISVWHCVANLSASCCPGCMCEAVFHLSSLIWPPFFPYRTQPLYSPIQSSGWFRSASTPLRACAKGVAVHAQSWAPMHR
jgi:hypothetical protein